MRPADAVLAAAGRPAGLAGPPAAILLAAGLLAAGVNAPSAPPPLDYLFPAGGTVGSNLTVTAGGKFDPWPVQAWTSAEGLVFQAGTEAGKFQVTIGPDVEPGPHWVRLHNDQGASVPRLFVAGELPDMLEAEPNNAAAQAQALGALPVTIHGRLEKDEDVDSFALPLKAGAWLVAAVDAYTLDSPIDPLLHLLDTNGTRIAFNHDGRSLDPLLAFPIERDGTYVLQLSAFAYPPQANVRLAGEAAAIYRLTCSQGPYPTHAFPAGVQRGQKTTVELCGWNLASNNALRNVTLDASHLANRQAHVQVASPGSGHRVGVLVGDLPELLEAEPNNTLDQAQPAEVPSIVNGRVGAPGDEDRFRFQALKEASYTAKIRAAVLGFPLDAVLRIEDARGKQLARGDDTGGESDAALTWKAPEAGDYIAVVSDLLERGGSDYIYQLELSPARPGIEIRMEEPALSLAPGKSVELNLTSSRVNGETNTWTVFASGLPDGVTSEAVTMARDATKAKLRLSAAAGAKRFGGLVDIFAAQGEGEARETRQVRARIKGKHAEAGDLLLNETDRLWLSVLPSPPPESGKASP